MDSFHWVACGIADEENHSLRTQTCLPVLTWATSNCVSALTLSSPVRGSSWGYTVDSITDCLSWMITHGTDPIGHSLLTAVDCSYFAWRYVPFGNSTHVTSLRSLRKPMTHRAKYLNSSSLWFFESFALWTLSFRIDRWFHQGPNPYSGAQDWIYSGSYWDRNYFNLPDIY